MFLNQRPEPLQANWPHFRSKPDNALKLASKSLIFLAFFASTSSAETGDTDGGEAYCALVWASFLHSYATTCEPENSRIKDMLAEIKKTLGEHVSKGDNFSTDSVTAIINDNTFRNASECSELDELKLEYNAFASTFAVFEGPIRLLESPEKTPVKGDCLP